MIEDALKARVLFALTDAYGPDEAGALWEALTGGETDRLAWDLVRASVRGDAHALRKFVTSDRSIEDSLFRSARTIAARFIETRRP